MDSLQAKIEKQIETIKLLIERKADKEKIQEERRKLDNLLDSFLEKK